jgi:hypothetical protein
MLRPRLLALLGLLLLALAPAAYATTVGDVASALREDPVFNEPDAQHALNADDVAELRSRIRGAGTPIFVAVLPARALSGSGDGDADALLQDIARKTGFQGSYALIVGDQFRGGSIGEASGAPEAATAAFQAHSEDGTRAVLDDFVDRVEDLNAGVGRAPDSGGGWSFLDGSWFWYVFFGIVALTTIRSGIFGYRRRQNAAQEMLEVSYVAREDLGKLQQDIIDLDPVYRPGRDQEVDEFYELANKELARAERRLSKATTVRDLGVVSRAIEEGRYHLACAKAAIEGRDLPPRSAPCFFNPQHGPSTQSVWWTPVGGGAPRDVPACDVCAHQLAEGREPAAREIAVDGYPVPHWQAPRYYAPWMGGYYGWPGSGFGFGDVFTGFLLGEAVSSSWVSGGTGGAVVGSDGGWIATGGGGGWSGGGDSGGWFSGGGGGDFGGGGDWGGGGGGGDSGGGGGGDSGGGSW